MEPTQTKSILLVEDDELIRDLYVTVLEDPQIKIDVAKDGQEGYDKIHAGNYDLILLDMLLPLMDGNIILQKLVGPDEEKKKNIVLLTNLDQEQTADVTNKANVKGYLIKSQIETAELKKKVHEYLSLPLEQK